ncbi:MAG: SWIM zinc finger family protein [Kofleriaceae bacterium]
MEFDYAFKRSSAVANRADATALSFSPDTKRPPTYFSGVLGKSVAFREAISALHDVVVSDLRWKPKDKTAYKAWAAQQEAVDWTQITAQRTGVAAQLKELQDRLATLQRQSSARRAPFLKAQRAYFDYLYQKDRDAWFVLDPVITVHPDELFFECFSQDESSYGRLGASYQVFRDVGEFACGTTNIDYSAALYDEFQKIRSYKTTSFEVDPSGFEVQTTGEASFKEVKIDLPDSWVRGFLQVNSAMSLPARTLELHPMDVHNLCFVLRRHREKTGPRSMRYCLTPGQPVRVVFDPWGIEVVCRRTEYRGTTAEEIRVWGRRRLHILERLIPIADRFTVHLLGSGMPSFYVADLGDLSFTLGLSGWTTNDWAAAGNFDLLAPRATVDPHTQQRVFAGLKETWFDTPDKLAMRLGLPRATVLSALGAWTQAGRAMFDLAKGVYRARELARDPLPMEQLRFASPREEAASRLLLNQQMQTTRRPTSDGGFEVTATVADGRHGYRPALVLDPDGRIVQGECGCNFYQHNKLHKGPCEHMLALRLHESRFGGATQHGSR